MAAVSDRTGQVNATQDENADGVIDRRDDEIAARRVGTTYASGSTMTAARPATATATATAPTVVQRPVIDQPRTEPTIRRDDSEVLAPVGPRPRASFLATLSLIVGVVAAAAVATGQLAGPGIALGVLAALIAATGIAATGSRYVAGKGDALLGLLLGLAAVVFGVLMVTGAVTWLSASADHVGDLHHWLQAHASWLLPS